MKSLVAHTGLMGSTAPGQRVTYKQATKLPPGTVLDLNDGKLIHLHDGLWLWVSGCAWCYDTLSGHLEAKRVFVPPREAQEVIGHLPHSTQV